MNRGDILDIINRVEEGYPVNKLLFDGVIVWPLIRTMIFNKLLNSAYYNSSAGSIKRSSIKDIYYIIKDYYTDRKSIIKRLENDNYSKKIKKAPFLLYGVSAHRSEKIDDKYYHRILDPLIEYLEPFGPANFLESSEGQRHNTPRHNTSTQIDKDLLLVKFFYLLRYSFKEISIEGLEEFLNFMQEKFPEVGISYNVIRSRVVNLLAYKSYFKKTFKKTGCRVLFTDIYYHDKCFAAIWAAKELNIKSIELQHGIQNNVHYAYCKWERLPTEGYAFLPNYFWVWTKREKINLDKWLNKSEAHHAIVGGNIFIEYIKKRPDLDMFRSKKNKHIKTVLFTLQKLSEEEKIKIEKIIFPVVIRHPQFLWVFRLHPCFLNNRIWLQQKVKEYGMSNVEIQEPYWPIYSVLKSVNYHITFYSTTALEALHFGIRSVVMGKDAFDFYFEEINEGIMCFAKNEKDIEEYLAGDDAEKVKIVEPNVQITHTLKFLGI